jgi:hypothetical protein
MLMRLLILMNFTKIKFTSLTVSTAAVLGITHVMYHLELTLSVHLHGLFLSHFIISFPFNFGLRSHNIK